MQLTYHSNIRAYSLYVEGTKKGLDLNQILFPSQIRQLLYEIYSSKSLVPCKYVNAVGQVRDNITKVIFDFTFGI